MNLRMKSTFDSKVSKARVPRPEMFRPLSIIVLHLDTKLGTRVVTLRKGLT